MTDAAMDNRLDLKVSATSNMDANRRIGPLPEFEFARFPQQQAVRAVRRLPAGCVRRTWFSIGEKPVGRRGIEPGPPEGHRPENANAGPNGGSAC